MMKMTATTTHWLRLAKNLITNKIKLLLYQNLGSKEKKANTEN